MRFWTVNPSTEERVAAYRTHTAAEEQRLVARAQRAAAEWRAATATERSRVLRRAAQLLLRRKRAAAERMALEMGKPVAQGALEAEKSAGFLAHYAEHARRHLSPERVEGVGEVRFEPLGTVLSIQPWNFPYYQALRSASQVLAAGNAMLLKHSSIVAGCAQDIERLFADAGAPPGLVTNLFVPHTRVEALVARSDAVAFTGSTEAGRAIASLAGRHLKPSVLELGGSDPFIVLHDADVNAAAAGAVAGRFRNCGQSCNAAKRFIVDRRVLAAFTEQLVRRAGELVVGDPLEPATDIGPLATRAQRDRIERQVSASVRAGARPLLGARRREGKGFFYLPTVLSRAAPGMPVFREETFGPVAPIAAAKSDAHAFELANATRYGLSASLWTRRRGLEGRIAAGMVSWNQPMSTDVRLPFGGIKDSGYGREFGRYGLLHYVNIKSHRPARR